MIKGWQQLPDDDYFTNRCAYTFEDGRTFVVAYCRYLFGVRIMGFWQDNEKTIEFDWCAGRDPEWLYRTHILMMTIVQKIPFKEIPRFSNVKPWYKDNEFAKKVDDLWLKALNTV